VGLLFWLLGLQIQNPGLMADDSGEIAAAASCLGLPHPPGYPLLTLLGNLAIRFLPLGGPAFRLNLMSEAFLIGAVFLTLSTARRLAQAAFPGVFPREGFHLEIHLALLATFLFFTPNVLGQALTAKGGVYTLTFLLLAEMVRTAVSEKNGFRSLSAVLGLYALGLGNHWQTQVLWVPAIGLWAWNQRATWGLRDWARAASMGVVGVSTYLVLPLRVRFHPPMSWGHPDRWGEFWWVISRKLASSNEGELRPWSSYEKFFAWYRDVMVNQNFPGLWFLALMGALWALWKFRLKALPAWALYGVSVAAILTYAREEVAFLVPVYLVSLQGLFVLAAFLGSSFLWEKVLRVSKSLASALLALTCVAVIFWAARSFRIEDKGRYTLAGDLGTNILLALPRNAFFLAEGDNTVFPIWYEQVAMGRRPDVLMAPPQFLAYRWGWGQVARSRPSLAISRAWAPIQDFLRTRERGNLFVSMDRTLMLKSGFDLSFDQLTPYGLCYGVGKGYGPTKGVEERFNQIHSRFRLRGLGVNDPSDPSRPLDLITRQVIRYYADDCSSFAHWLARSGIPGDSIGWFDRSLGLKPDQPELYGDLAVVFMEEGYPEVSMGLCREGLREDPANTTLCQILGMGFQSAGTVPARAKIRKYHSLADQARRKGWSGLVPLIERTLLRVEGESHGKP